MLEWGLPEVWQNGSPKHWETRRNDLWQERVSRIQSVELQIILPVFLYRSQIRCAVIMSVRWERASWPRAHLIIIHLKIAIKSSQPPFSMLEALPKPMRNGRGKTVWILDPGENGPRMRCVCRFTLTAYIQYAFHSPCHFDTKSQGRPFVQHLIA